MTDELCMQRALDIAQHGAGHVSPNPMVGCVLVADGRVIGEGYHQKYGGAHAEVHAVQSVRAEDEHLLAQATAYVTLEPCAHFGKTPPCADLLISKQVKRVVVAIEDPFPLVAGKGIQRMREAGIKVDVGVLADEAAWINRRFLVAVKKNRPFIILKWAESADGFMGTTDRKPVAISDKPSLFLSHRWRTEEDAILVGSTTVLQDNPSLTARYWQGRNPKRIVLDKRGRIDSSYQIRDEAAETLIFTQNQEILSPQHQFIDPTLDFEAEVLNFLFKNGVRSILVEGGQQVLNDWIEKKLFDEIRTITSPNRLREGIASPRVPAGVVLKESYAIGIDTYRQFTNLY